MKNLKLFLKVSLGIILSVITVFVGLFFSQGLSLTLWLLPVLMLLIFIIFYSVILSLVNRFISEKIQQIIKEGPFNSGESSATVITDMDLLSREVEKFARDKQEEIDFLNIRENYRKEFIGNVAHELKTPLFTVQGYIYTLIDGAKDNPEILGKYLEGAAKGVDRLVNIVGDLDMIAELEYSGLTFDREAFDIIDLIRNAVALLEIKAQKRKIGITFDRTYSNPIFVFADKLKIEQVLINILENSLKYGKKNGTTEIAIDDISALKVLIRITDNGEGISAVNLPRVFERFYRIDKSGSRKEGGSGLGLAIVKHIIEAHSEKIYVESQLGVGSEFSFTLPKNSELISEHLE